MYLSRYEIEKIARRIITAYKNLPSVKGRQVNRVCPEVLAKDLLGLSIEHHVLSPNGAILGLTTCGEVGVPVFDHPGQLEYLFLDGKTLLIDKQLTAMGANKGRYHFTLVHEACHQIYKMLYPKEYINGVAKRQIHYCMSKLPSGSNYWEEWRTNALTSAILMPSDMVRSNMMAFGLGEKMKLLNKVFAPNDFDHFQKMADYMGVSQKALSIRLKQLRLLEVDHLGTPYELVDIFPAEEETDVQG